MRLAALARTIRDRIQSALAIETERGPYQRLLKAFQQALIHDLDADGFADIENILHELPADAAGGRSDDDHANWSGAGMIK